MPFYEYQCSRCGHHHEVLQKVSDAPLRKCPECGRAALKRLMSAPVFRLKGGGWYETDFKSDKDAQRNLAGDKEPPAGKAAEAKPEAGPSAGATADDKPAAAAKPAADKAPGTKPAPASAAAKRVTGKAAARSGKPGRR